MRRCRHSLFLFLLVVSLAATVGTVSASSPVKVVDVSNDQTAQNETPLAANPLNSKNLITGANDWNYNDGCAVNASFDGGKSWSPTLPNGFLPGVTKFTNDPNVAGTGAYDAGGDPVIAFGPDGTAYYACQAFSFTPPYQIALLVSRSTDGGRTWLDGSTQKLTQVSTWNGNGKSKGSNGQFPDHESIYVDKSPTSPYYGSIYVTWVQFDGQTHSPVYVAASRDGAHSFSAPVQVTSSTIRNNQDARLTSAPDGTLYLTFDNGVQGGKGTLSYVSKSSDGAATWSAPTVVAAFNNPVCTFPPDCFNISGAPFRSGGSYPTPAFDTVRNRLDVIYPDIVGPYGQIYFTSSAGGDLGHWTKPIAIVPGDGDRFQNEMSIASNGRIDVSFYDRSYSQNQQVDITLASSADGGKTWSSRRVTSTGFDPALWGVPGGSSPRPFIGDYNGIVSFSNAAGLTWTGIGATGAPFNLEIDYATVSP